MRSLFLILCATWIAAAQTERIEVTGKVVNSETGEPVANARVTLRAFGQGGRGGQAPNPFGTLPLLQQGGPSNGLQGSTSDPVTTGGDGRFIFKDINQGYLQLVVEATGYLRSQTTENQLANQTQIDATVRLVPLGSVSGRIVDEAGRPAARVEVALFRKASYTLGDESLEVVDRKSTDDRGEFRIYWVPAGWYYLSASDSYSNQKLSAAGSSVDRTSVYRTIYYPGSPDSGTASGFSVKPGANVRLQEMVSRPVELHRVRGRAIDGRTGKEIPLDRLLADAGFASRQVRSGGFSSNGRARPDGTFEVAEVAKGRYWLRVRAYETEKTPRPPNTAELSGIIPIDVGDSDLNDLVVTLYPAATITGRITLNGPEAQSKILLEGQQVSLFPAMAYPSSFSRNPSGMVADDGTFRIENIQAGPYVPALGGSAIIGSSSRETYVTEARFNQTDLLESPMMITGNTTGELRITLSAQPARLDGKVLNGDLALEALLVPKDLNRNELYQSAFVNPDGSFSMPTVIPGDYTLYIWEQRPAREYFDPNFIRRFANRGTPVHLSPLEHVRVEPSAISRVEQ